MRIALLSREYPPQTGWGGIGTYVYFVSHALAAAGHAVQVISRSDRSEEYTHSDGPVTVHRIRERKPCGLLGDWLCALLPLSDWAYSRRAAQKAWELHERQPLDIIEAPEYRAEAYHLVRHNPAPVVVKTHTPTFMLEQLNGMPRSFREDTVKRMEASTARRAQALASPSRNLAGLLAKAWGLNGQAIRILPYPIDIARLSAQPWTAHPPTVLFVGRFEPRKGVHVLVEAVPQVIARVSQARFVFVGGHAENAAGAKPFMKRLLERLDALGCRDRVTFVAWQKPDALLEFYRKAWVVAIPSLYDNYPNVCLEAMASARPVVGSRVGGIPEMVEDGKCGFLVPPGDCGALAQALANVLAHSDTAKALGQAARRFVEERLSPVRIAQETAAFYEEVIQRQGAH
jgi:glycosyltransferase involved in cell wall biosynthesis